MKCSKYCSYYYFPTTNNLINQIVESTQAANAMVGLIILSIILNGISWFLFSELIFLHIWLKHRNLTTYEFILLRRERKNRSTQKEQNESQNGTLPNQSEPKEQKQIKITYKSKVILKVDDAATISHEKSSIMHFNQGNLQIRGFFFLFDYVEDSHIGGFEHESKDQIISHVIDETQHPIKKGTLKVILY